MCDDNIENQLPLPRIIRDEENVAVSRDDSTAENRHYVIHFDINETILVGDEAGGDSSEDCLNKMLAKNSYVRMAPQPPKQASSQMDGNVADTENFEPTHWWDHTPILSLEEHENHKNPANITPLVTTWEWPADTCPYYRTKYKKLSKNFVENHGAMYRPLYEHLRSQLPKLPVTDESGDGDKKNHMLSHILPALFETLIAMGDDTTNNNNQYTVVFRTMGTDLEDIAEVVASFSRGQHPLYPNYSNPRFELPTTQLYQGRWQTLSTTTEECETNRYVYQLWQNGKLVASGDEDVLKVIHSHKICGIQDDYQFWKHHNFEPWAGKPVWILSDGKQQQDSVKRQYYHLLFDDNIWNIETYSIAGVRKQVADTSEFVSLSNKETRTQHGKHLMRVPTFEPILNKMWFWEQICKLRHFER